MQQLCINCAVTVCAVGAQEPVGRYVCESGGRTSLPRTAWVAGPKGALQLNMHIVFKPAAGHQTSPRGLCRIGQLLDTRTERVTAQLIV